VDYTWIYITCKDKEEALNIARNLVEEKLIACGNVLDNMTAVYSWKEKIEVDSEAVLICKTKKSLFEAVRTKVSELHSYDCPCIISIPIERGDIAYLKWISENTN